MKLSYTETDYINQRMDSYDIKYQEIYDEAKDHMISAVEAARAVGDERNIATVYAELLAAHFPGFWVFHDISKQYEKAYRAKLRRNLWGNFSHYVTGQAVGLVSILVITGFYLPQNKITSLIMMIAMIIIAMVIYGYAYHESRKIKLNAGKRSMVKDHVVRYGFFPIAIINVILNLIGMFGRDYNIHYLNPRYFHPVVYILLLAFFMLYGLSSIRLCRQELKIGK